MSHPRFNPTAVHIAIVALESKETQKSMQKTVTANVETSGLRLSIINNWRLSMAVSASGRNTSIRRHRVCSSAMLAIHGVPDQRK